VARHDRLRGVVALALVALSACGVRQNAAGEPTPTTSRSTVTTTTTTSSPPPIDGGISSSNQENPCTAASLSGTIEAMESAPGNRYARLIVQNTGKQTCTLQGYGNIELLNATKQPIPTKVERNLNPVTTLVRLDPDGTSSKILHWSVVATGDEPTEGPCQPQASAINVKPPDEIDPFQVSYEFGPVCDHGRIETSAYYPG
jgi:hypothetical protein